MPWSHSESRDIDYSTINNINAESVYETLLINDFIRPPSKRSDIDDLIKIFKKVLN